MDGKVEEVTDAYGGSEFPSKIRVNP
jgi:hypothetical protein